MHEAMTMQMAPVTPAAPEPVAPEKKKKGNPVVGFLALGVVVAVLIFAFSSCGSSHDDSASQDTQYLMALDRDNVPHGMFSNILKLGQAVCKDLDKPMSLNQVLGEVEGLSEDKTTTVQHPYPVPRFTTQQSQAIVYDAIQVYCPQFQAKISDPTH
ncbi:DUF732 domain-containing protein [Nocardia sp. NPDC046763]|uniref:DUF732 domain-containing protein n=1 Tax=Nocardia sp. NPDC046763 TaxID=3155256 RepID=UPI0033DCD5B1